jgi:hypothetical protein
MEKAYFYNYANGARGSSGLGRPVGFGKGGPVRVAGPKVKKKDF